jgi:uncharacterized protein (DUF302 family)
MGYAMTHHVDGEFEKVVAYVVDELVAEGFGVLSDVDVRAVLVERLGVTDYPRYRLLGVCTPELAERGLAVDEELGALLPCTVAVYEPRDDDGVVVSVADPEAVLGLADDPALDPVAADAGERFDRALTRVEADTGTW